MNPVDYSISSQCATGEGLPLQYNLEELKTRLTDDRRVRAQLDQSIVDAADIGQWRRRMLVCTRA